MLDDPELLNGTVRVYVSNALSGENIAQESGRIVSSAEEKSILIIRKRCGHLPFAVRAHVAGLHPWGLQDHLVHRAHAEFL